MASTDKHPKDSLKSKNNQPPVISIIQATLFGVLPGIAFALSIYISLAIVTLLARALRILG